MGAGVLRMVAWVGPACSASVVKCCAEIGDGCGGVVGWLGVGIQHLCMQCSLAVG
jgi:hypothetical protein